MRTLALFNWPACDVKSLVGDDIIMMMMDARVRVQEVNVRGLVGRVPRADGCRLAGC